MTVGLVYAPIYLRHDTGAHVERAARLEAVMQLLAEKGVLPRLTLLPPPQATVEQIALAHAPEYITHIERQAKAGGGWLDADTVMSAESYEVALSAAGGVLRAVEAVMAGEVETAFALVRPPGHHATYWKAGGFCLFNNIAIAARHALKNLSVNRILIADFDVHHGNGTQDAFYADSSVLYFSTHQAPLYPGTGSLEETGVGEGQGSTVNLPLPAMCGDKEYKRAYEEILVPVARRFQPELILVSAGYDAHRRDPIARMRLTVSGFGEIVRVIKRLATELCQGRLVFTLEGGYHLEALSHSVMATLQILLGEEDIFDPFGPSLYPAYSMDISALLKLAKELHGL